MSLKQTLEKTIENAIDKYAKVIADTYNLDKKKLLALWDDSEKSSVQTSVQTSEEKFEELDPVYLIKCKKPELKALCKMRGVRCTGTKAQLIGYLQGKVHVSTPKKAKKDSKKEAKKDAKKEAKVVKKLNKKIPIIAIRKNKHGNHEHPETRLVFDNKLKKVIGVQQDDGGIAPLTVEDIDLCNKFKFSFALPENLDSNKLDDETVDELEDEELDEVEEEELEEEELEEEELEEEELEEEELEEEEFTDEDIYEEEA